MSQSFIPKHHIQIHILGVLMHQKYARFSDMRPLKAETNLYSYHLKVLQQVDFVVKVDQSYTLGKTGLIYAGRSAKELGGGGEFPEITIGVVVQNSNGDILIQKRHKQPFIDTWTLPGSHILVGDKTLEAAARRVIHECLGLPVITPRHAGDYYIRITHDGSVVMGRLMHIFRFETDDIASTDDLVWARPHRLSDYALAPAVEQIITRSFFNDPHFFEEHSEDLAS